MLCLDITLVHYNKPWHEKQHGTRDEDNKQGDEANHHRDDGHDNKTLERMIKKKSDKNMKKSENEDENGK